MRLSKTSPVTKPGAHDQLLDPLSAAHHLGVTSELLFGFSRASFARSSGLRSLASVQDGGRTWFGREELVAFDNLLRGPWPDTAAPRRAIPKAIVDHLRAEAGNACARCGSGVGVDNAHIESWAITRSHHPANLIRLCSGCHREHDVENSLSTADLKALKADLVERTRRALDARRKTSESPSKSPRAASSFFGRDGELAVLTHALRVRRSILVEGVGGIGKTELLLQALRAADTRRPVIWIDVEAHPSALDLMSELRRLLGGGGPACSVSDVPGRLDALQACLVLDGIERATGDDLNRIEETLEELGGATTAAQFVATSQVKLYGWSVDARLALRKLDAYASRRLLEASSTRCAPEAHPPLVAFCGGHALTLRLAGALADHYEGGGAALAAITRKGAKALRRPGRSRHDRSTSLEACLETAYAALSTEGRRLLWAIAECPAGIFSDLLTGPWLELAEPEEALAEVARWHLIELIPVRNELLRAQLLSPVRAFVAQRGREQDFSGYAEVIARVVNGHFMLVGVFELRYDDPHETPLVLSRFSEELPNLLHVVALAREFDSEPQLVDEAVSIIRSLMRHYFVAGLAADGARIMREMADLALARGATGRLSGLVLQTIALSDRAEDAESLHAGVALAEGMASSLSDPESLGDIEMCRAIAARRSGDFTEVEARARQAFTLYRDALRSAGAGPTCEGDPERAGLDDLHNNVANALGLLGLALLQTGRFAEAAAAYKHSMRHERGAAIAVNRGQVLHQIGNCEGRLGHYLVAAEHYVKAASIFHFVGMQEYLSNALGELGYLAIDLDVQFLAGSWETGLIEHGIEDLLRDARRVFVPAHALDHSLCVRMIRKVFGMVALCSLLDDGPNIADFCSALRRELIDPMHDQLMAGARAQDECYPLMWLDLALWLGFHASDGTASRARTGAVPEDLTWEMLRVVCNADKWARNTMRLVDWFSALLTRRWRLSGAERERFRDFVDNFDHDVVDHLELSPEEFP